MDRPQAPRGPAPHVLDAALKRRAELHASSRLLVAALEAPSPGRERAWLAPVVDRLRDFREDIAEHIASTEAPDGLYAEVRAAAPRLIHQVDSLVADHAVLRERVESCYLLATSTDAPDAALVATLREEATAAVALLQRHRQRGSDLVFEAYETDIGGTE